VYCTIRLTSLGIWAVQKTETVVGRYVMGLAAMVTEDPLTDRSGGVQKKWVSEISPRLLMKFETHSST
jgi:hypothetical protein